MYCLNIVPLALLFAGQLTREDLYGIISGGYGSYRSNVAQLSTTALDRYVKNAQTMKLAMFEYDTHTGIYRVCSETMREITLERAVVVSSAYRENIMINEVVPEEDTQNTLCQLQLRGEQVLGKKLDRISQLGDLGQACLPRDVIAALDGGIIEVKGIFSCYGSNNQISGRTLLADVPMDLTSVYDAAAPIAHILIKGVPHYMWYVGNRLLITTLNKRKTLAHAIRVRTTDNIVYQVLDRSAPIVYLGNRITVSKPMGRARRLGGTESSSAPVVTAAALALFIQTFSKELV